MLVYQNENIGKSYAFRSRYHRSGYTIPPHIHEYTELLWVLDGIMTMNLDGRKLLVPAGSAALVFPNQVHEYTQETPCSCWCAVFSNDFLDAFYRLYPEKIPENPVVNFEKYRDLQEMLADSVPDDTVGRVGVLHLLFSEMLRQTALVERPQANDALYPAAINYISARFREDFTLSDMARALGYHEKYLSAKLHQLTGMNFRSFLSTYRVDCAKRLLRSTEMNMCEIALESGFSSLNTFNRAFRLLAGLTPTDYRRHHPMHV